MSRYSLGQTEPVLKELPSSVDWRKVNGTKYVNDIKDQGICGAAWAFSAVSVLESRYAIASGTLLDLSEQQIISCTLGLYGTAGCDGGNDYIGFTYVSMSGLMTEKDYPYIA